jgi:hypothetical protein
MKSAYQVIVKSKANDTRVINVEAESKEELQVLLSIPNERHWMLINDSDKIEDIRHVY